MNIIYTAAAFLILVILYQIQHPRYRLYSFVSSSLVAGAAIALYTFTIGKDYPIPGLVQIWAIAAASVVLTMNSTQKENGKNGYKPNPETDFFLETNRGERIFFGYPQDNFLVYGGAGSGKTKSIGKPIMEQFIRSRYAGFIYDFKDFDYTKTAWNLVKQYEYDKLDTKGVKRDFYYVSFTDLDHTFRFNPLKRFRTMEVVNPVTGETEVNRIELINRTMLLQLMSDFLRAFLPEKGKEDEWFQGALGILQGVAFRLWDDCPEYLTLPHICNIITTYNNEELTHFLEQNATASSLAGAFLSSAGSEKTQASYISTLNNYIGAFANNLEATYVLSGDEFTFDLVDPNNPKLFAVCNNYAINRILSPVISMLFSISSRRFSFSNRQNFVYVLDEMTTFKVQDFEMLPSTLREFGVAFVLLTQSGAKLEKLYSKLDRSSIEANFANMFLGRTKDVEALKYYPSFFGKHEVQKKSRTRGTSSGGSNNSVTLNTQKEDVYEAKVFTGLQPGEFIGSAGHTNKPEFREQFKQFRFTGNDNGKIKGEEEDIPLRINPQDGSILHVTPKMINDAWKIVTQNVKTLKT